MGFLAGQKLRASDLNNAVSLGGARYISADTSSTVALTGGTGIANFATVQRSTTDVTASVHSGGLANDTFTFNRAGTYSVTSAFRCFWATLPTSGDIFYRAQLVSGAIDLGGATDDPIVGFKVIGFSIEREFAVNDQITFQITNSTNHTLAFAAVAELFHCAITWVGP